MDANVSWFITLKMCNIKKMQLIPECNHMAGLRFFCCQDLHILTLYKLFSLSDFLYVKSNMYERQICIFCKLQFTDLIWESPGNVNLYSCDHSFASLW